MEDLLIIAAVIAGVWALCPVFDRLLGMDGLK